MLGLPKTITTIPTSLALTCASVAVLAGPAPASGPGFVRHEALVRFEGRSAEHSVELPAGVGVGEAVRALERNPEVAYAAPNQIAHVSAKPPGPGSSAPFIPNDPGTAGASGGWQQMQWNFLPCGSTCGEPPAAPNLESPGGINAPGAWQNLIAAGRPGGKGVTVAVVDTGIAYRDLGQSYKRSPDFDANQFVTGRDFVEHDDVALDENGHGTHVAGTIAEQTHNERALSGLAYGARIMPVRVLNARGEGTARNVARGIRWASDHGAQVINLSLEFCLYACKPSAQVLGCEDVPGVCEAIDAAQARGAIVIASAGNEGATEVAFPGRHAIAVGATTEHGCLAEYANHGEGLDLVAPGGGADGPVPGAQCTPYIGGRTIYQLTLVKPGKHGSYRRFGYPSYEGCSMASAHVSAAAALVWAQLAAKLGHDPTPAQVEARLESTARKDGILADQSLYGAGLLDAAAATAPSSPAP
ncbi:MAG TPA: S8 family serine peptidase [Solirubrobacterales bacterium]|nr:S8 family serine peptidase [Solirubrobacterales bacterium]